MSENMSDRMLDKCQIESQTIYIYTPEYSSENLPEYTSDELPEYICLLERQNICQINVSWRGSLDEHVFLLRFGRVLQET